MIDNHINIQLVLAGRQYKLKVDPAEEAIVRSAAKDINDQIIDYQQKFPSKDKQDFLIMLLLHQKVESFRKSGNQSQSDQWMDRLNELDDLLTQNLSQ
ncbi:MAG: cell division protein ZapA [Chitinophagales bacterium]|nr:cell division protein ZapA [Chitinophagales bacterium]